MNPVHNITTYFFKNHFNNILPLIPSSETCLIPLFPIKIMQIASQICMLHALPIQRPWFIHPPTGKYDTNCGASQNAIFQHPTTSFSLGINIFFNIFNLFTSAILEKRTWNSDNTLIICRRILCFVVKKNQLDAQLILSIFRQPLHVSGYLGPSSGGTTIVTYYSLYPTVRCPGWIGTIRPGQQAVI
jgi:hypothetical protein